jgi:hypothetical protein
MDACSVIHGTRVTQAPTDCPHVSPLHKRIVAAMVGFLQTSPLACFDRDTKTGHWRLLVVRNTTAGEGMRRACRTVMTSCFIHACCMQ